MARLFWLDLQLFGGEGGGAGAGSGAAAGAPAGDSAGGAEGAAASGEMAPAAEETRLRELGVPESVLAKRAKRAKASRTAPAQNAAMQAAPRAQEQEQNAAAAQQDAAAEEAPEEGEKTDSAPTRMSWDEIMADPEYNERMQETIRSRLKSAKSAEESMTKLAPAIELLARKYGLDANNLDVDKLTSAISDDDAYYEDKALEMGVSVETAKKIDQNEREAARREAEQARTIEQQKFAQHIERLQRQGEELKKTFTSFDLATELRNPVFARMTSPNVGISVEDAYYAIHRKEIQTAAMQVTAQKTAQQMANAIRSNMSRPVENGTSAQAPSNTTFDYAHASKEQREMLKRQIREAAAKGQKLYPGQR